MGPSNDRPNPPQRQGRRRRSGPRARRCLLKGCQQWFEPPCPQARYCGDACRQAAARWRGWKSRQRYRQTEGGRACRREQSRRRRARLADKKRREERGCPRPRGPAWVIAQQKIFMQLRPAWLLRNLPSHASLSGPTILFTAVPACPRARRGTRATLATAMGRAAARAPAAVMSGAYCAPAGSSRTLRVHLGGGGRSRRRAAPVASFPPR